MKPVSWVFALGFSVLVTAQAAADVPPDPRPSPGPPVPECTAQRVAGPRSQCVDCRAWYEAPNRCQELAAQGYRQACRAPGATVWNEVWCRGSGAPETKRGCGSCEVGSERSTTALALALGGLCALALVARRR